MVETRTCENDGSCSTRGVDEVSDGMQEFCTMVADTFPTKESNPCPVDRVYHQPDTGVPQDARRALVVGAQLRHLIIEGERVQ